jgi:formiminoglutamate deiminase
VPGTSTYHCEWAWLGDADAAADVLVAVDGERITAVTAGVAEPPREATLLRGLTLPGLANAHSHAFHRLLRGRTHGGGRGSFWTWRDEMYAAAATLDPERYHRVARAVYAEMALAGITTVGEFHYLHHQPDGTPYDDPNAMGAALVAAARDVGIRLTLLDACYLHGGIAAGPNGAAAGLDGVQRRFGDGDGDAWAARVGQLRDADDVRIGAAIHSVRAVDPKTMELVAAWATERAAPLHAHVSEQPAENEQCRAAYGCTPVALLADLGVLGDRFTAVHATHLSGGDVAQLGAAAVTCCFCPTTERDLADGIGPARALLDAGARLCLGSDSHAVIDPLEDARAVELHERLASGERGRHHPAALLTMATAAGHASLGWPDAGRLVAGAPADLVTIGADSVRTAGLARDPLGVAVFAAAAGDVTHVVASGRVIVADGHHVHIDAVAELRGVL